MEHYLFEGEIQGKYRSIEIYPMAKIANRYLIHWDGFQVGTIYKQEDGWHTDDEALVDFVGEISAFIEDHESKLKKEKEV